MGGINKDTSSVCFSPHAVFHESSARLAEEVSYDQDSYECLLCYLPTYIVILSTILDLFS